MSEQLRARLAIVGTLFTVIAIWMLAHPYLGIEYNDSALYSLLAMARLHPQSLPADVFLRFGSQDTYTVFSPLFAAAIRMFDLEPAAAALAFAGQMTFIICGWLLARSVMSARLALLSVGLLIALPSNYGVAHSFNYVESFLTPRQLAEAAILAALAANLARRYALMCVCLLAAIVLHPIMALAGIVMLGCLHVAVPRPKLALVVAACAALLSLVPILVIPHGNFAPFDPQWLSLVTSGAWYLFLWQWKLADWAHVALSIAVLALGASTSSVPVVRKLCLATVLTAACSLAVCWFYLDVLHSVLFTQMQPWRWLWLVASLAVLLLPVIIRDCWRIGPPGRTAVVLLGATWMLSYITADSYVAWTCIALACIACMMIRFENPPAVRLIFFASCALLVCAFMGNLAFKLQYVALNATDATHENLLDAKALQSWGGDGVLYALALVGAWSLIAWQGSRLSALLLCAAAGISCLALVPLAWRSWTNFHYTAQSRASFAPWRDLIPQHAQVVWPRNPMGAWYLLERPSYYSGHQLAGDVFSRPKAIEIHRRASLVASALQATAPSPVTPTHASGTARSDDGTPTVPPNADNLNAPGLAVLCSDPQLDFYVSWTSLGPTPAGVIVPNPAKPRHQLHLYRCADLGNSSG
jgi:hypothetical protein